MCKFHSSTSLKKRDSCCRAMINGYVLARNFCWKRNRPLRELILLLRNRMLLHRHFPGLGFDISQGRKCSDRVVSEGYELQVARLSTFIPWFVEPMGVPCISMMVFG